MPCTGFTVERKFGNDVVQTVLSLQLLAVSAQI